MEFYDGKRFMVKEDDWVQEKYRNATGTVVSVEYCYGETILSVVIDGESEVKRVKAKFVIPLDTLGMEVL